jgi:hypothetical protein
MRLRFWFLPKGLPPKSSARKPCRLSPRSRQRGLGGLPSQTAIPFAENALDSRMCLLGLLQILFNLRFLFIAERAGSTLQKDRKRHMNTTSEAAA